MVLTSTLYLEASLCITVGVHIMPCIDVKESDSKKIELVLKKRKQNLRTSNLILIFIKTRKSA